MTATESTSHAVMVDGLTKTYGHGETLVRALDGISFDVDPGEFVVLLGPSGSGKTTTLNLLGAIEEPTAGRLQVGQHDISALDEGGRTEYRREEVGFVFQLYNLVPSLTAMENVQLIAEITGPDAANRALAALEEVGIAERADHFPGQLSGGQQQLVAIARAIVKDPSLLLCDEPTGALDLDRGRVVLGVLADLAAEGRTVVCVTHNSTIATMATRVLKLSDGRIVDDVHQSDPVSAGDLVW